MPPAALPPCGVYRTKTAVAGIEAGRLVYFHNHGDPGPGLYPPESWAQNRAKFSERGQTVPADFDPKALEPLPPEGFYRVTKDFFCCEKKCAKFETDMFVQLGFNGAGRALVFVPQLGGAGLALPDRGSIVDDNVLENLVPLKISQNGGEQKSGEPEINISLPRGFNIH